MLRRSKLTIIPVLALLSLIAGTAAAQEIRNVDASEVGAWLDEGRRFAILDVRSRAEFIWTGHPEGAINLPLYFWDPEGGMTVNENFLREVQERFSKDETIVVICRSGGRSAMATGILTAAGYARAFNFVNGFEGQAGPEGHRDVSGWRNEGLPWSYESTPGQRYSPPEPGPQDP